MIHIFRKRLCIALARDSKRHGRLGHTCVVLAIASLTLSMAARPSGDKPVPVSEAVLSGYGDVYDKEPLNELSLEGTNLGDVHDLAGSWVYFYEYWEIFRVDTPRWKESRERAIKRIEEACRLQEDLAHLGLIVVAVSDSPPSEEAGYPPLNHPLWVTDQVVSGRGPNYGRPTLLDDFLPSELLVDPVGLISAGGRRLPLLGLEKAVPDIEDFRTLITAYPGMPLNEVPAAHKIRRAIAKRQWSRVYKLADASSPLRATVDSITNAQLDWSRSHLDGGDSLSARVRLSVIDDLPEVDQRERHKELVGRCDDNKESARTVQTLLNVAEELKASIGFRQAYISPRKFRKISKKMTQLEADELDGPGRIIFASLKRQLENWSPETPCKGCSNPRHRCSC